MDSTSRREMLARLSGVVLDSLDDAQKTEDLARSAYQSRTQFHRVFRAIIDETPAAMRRRLVLERAAFQLLNTKSSITDIALDANYGSLEAFTRAFRKAFQITKEVWAAALAGHDLPNLKGTPPEGRTPSAMLARLESTDRELQSIFQSIQNRGAWDDTFVDALCEPAETFTFGGVFAHIMTFNAHRRLMALHALRQLGVRTEGFGDPMEYEESVAPLRVR